MLVSLSLAALSTSVAAQLPHLPLTDYPGFRNPTARIEAVIDRGLIQELIIRCGGGTAIISYSKVERLYCGPSNRCHTRLPVVAERACGGK
jgi:hypothetical protein